MLSLWWLYLLIFVFGYYTCKTFYILREARIGIVLLKYTHALYLVSIVKGLENLEYAKSIKLIEMSKLGASEKNINAVKINFEDEINRFKRKTVSDLIEQHPSFYKDIVDFHDWDSAMIYLNTEGAKYIKKFAKDD